MWAQVTTHPDLSYAVGILTCFQYNPSPTYDNLSSMALAESTKGHSHAKHIDIKYHYICKTCPQWGHTHQPCSLH
ncbi:hypothetical protein J132_06736 [Termitomyces sp. J132]|nr:hypothetical protein J132_06736 [Termitomyces sp. J132]